MNCFLWVSFFLAKYLRVELTGSYDKCIFIYLNKFIYLFLAVVGLCCCLRAFSSCGEWGLLFVVVCGLLIAVPSLVAEHKL